MEMESGVKLNPKTKEKAKFYLEKIYIHAAPVALQKDHMSVRCESHVKWEFWNM